MSWVIKKRIINKNNYIKNKYLTKLNNLYMPLPHFPGSIYTPPNIHFHTIVDGDIISRITVPNKYIYIRPNIGGIRWRTACIFTSDEFEKITQFTEESLNMSPGDLFEKIRTDGTFGIKYKMCAIVNGESKIITVGRTLIRKIEPVLNELINGTKSLNILKTLASSFPNYDNSFISDYSGEVKGIINFDIPSNTNKSFESFGEYLNVDNFHSKYINYKRNLKLNKINNHKP